MRLWDKPAIVCTRTFVDGLYRTYAVLLVSSQDLLLSVSRWGTLSFSHAEASYIVNLIVESRNRARGRQ